MSFQGHHEVVSTLLIAKANVDCRDRNQWTPLMWALTNRHKNIAKTLLDHGASPEVKTSSGRRALDFAAPNSEIADYLHDNGYHIGDAGVRGDFYDAGFSQDRFEQEMEEQEMRRRMQMESSVNLEVDLASLGLDERPEVGLAAALLRINLLIGARHPKSLMTTRTLCGTDVFTTRCSFSRKVTSIKFSTSLSPT